ncbi:MAG: 16S rRNA (cytidine(1402)-2'-O)-methyltransferase [Candidatus Giovannonibacteria bacterium]|nr:MAG: 16S rRNA (cytidine(1402)-2'-O)-methyltransferase [Candidatus Giovannonibacteria bacterium]
MPKLFIVATPIGNLKDITFQAVDVLKSVDAILAEDTRVTRKLLAHLDIPGQTISFREHSSPKILEKILNLIKEDKNLALVTDAGTPGISDPGLRLINAAKNIADIVPIPGPSALSAIISVSDINLSEFCFFGFPPRKKGRRAFFARVANMNTPAILFESPHRVQKTLRELELACGDRYANIGRELTKIHEEIFRGKLSEAKKHFTGERQRGEFTMIIDTK